MTEQPIPESPVPETSQPTAPPWSVRETWYGVGLLIVVLAAVVVLIYALRTDRIAGALPMTIAELAYLAPVVIIILAHKGRGASALGFRRFDWRVLGLGCGLLIAVYAVSLCQNMILLGMKVETQGQSILGLLHAGESVLDLILSTVIAAPFIEEIFFRSFLFQGLRQGYGWKWAAVISSLVFAAAHLQLSVLLPTFLLGLVFAVVYNRANSIWPGVILHFTMNAAGICMLLVSYWLTSLPQFTP